MARSEFHIGQLLLRDHVARS